MTRYPPIADYAFIGDGHSAALVSRDGSIDWCCMSRIDHGSCFGRLLDWDRGGHCRIAPAGDGWTVGRRYIEGTLVLETRFAGERGEVRLLDCYAMRAGGRLRPYNQILRVVEGVRGAVELRFEVRPRFEYGLLEPWVRAHGDGLYTAVGGDEGLVIRTDAPLAPEDHQALGGLVTVRAGERRRLTLQAVPAHTIYPSEPRRARLEEADRRLERTLRWWARWTAQAERRPADATLAAPAIRSAIVIKGMANPPTGAIVAAPTTSLPEAPGGQRNWDYRYSWIRDSVFALRSLGVLGYRKEARGFRAFIERTTAGSPAQLQVAYGIGGEHRLTEIVLEELEGYRGAAPVRIGNAAWRQLQLDIYGAVLELAWDAEIDGCPADEDYWRFLRGVVDHVAEAWKLPDRSIWEVRGEPRHFVYSKVMCWTALDRGIKLAERRGAGGAQVARWRAARDEVRAAVESRGYDAARGVFVQAFDAPHLDAALLLLPQTGFVEYDDPRMVRTVEAIRAELTAPDGLLRRYLPERTDDGLPGGEGTFIACTFWLVECLASQGRDEEARRVFDHVSSLANDVGLFSEEWDPARGEMLGNFPQGLTHYSHIAAAVAIAKGGPPESRLARGFV